MSSKAKDKQRKRKKVQWDLEKAEIENYRKLGPGYKAALRTKGCVLPFYEILDSAEEEFHRIVTCAKSVHPSLHEVYEVEMDDLEDEVGWKRLGLPSDWSQVFYTCEDELAESYQAKDKSANLRGAATAFFDDRGGFHTIIQVIKNPKCDWEHKEYKYILKLPVLLHEIGHVKDYEEKINFNRDAKTADLIEGEVYANIFALTECFRRGYYLGGEMFLDSWAKYKNDTDCRGEMVRRLFQRFQKPTYTKWMDFELEPKP
jgi:hypothetical protein